MQVWSNNKASRTGPLVVISVCVCVWEGLGMYSSEVKKEERRAKKSPGGVLMEKNVMGQIL